MAATPGYELLDKKPNDDHEFYKDGGDSAVPAVALNLSNAIVGAGIIGIPYALKLSGVIFGLILLLGVACIAYYSLCLLVQCGIVLRLRSYEQLARKTLGIPGQVGVLLARMLFDFGACLTYLIIMGDTSTELMILAGYNFKGLRQLCIAGLSIVFMLPLSLLRDISGLEKAASLAIASVFTVAVLMTIRLFMDPPDPDIAAIRFTFFEENGGNIKDVIQAVGVFSFAWVIQDCAFLFYNTLKDGTPARWSSVAIGALGGASLLTTYVGLIGYWTFHETTLDNVLTNYASDDKLAVAMRGMYVITMLLTYPIGLFVCREVVEESFIFWAEIRGSGENTEPFVPPAAGLEKYSGVLQTGEPEVSASDDKRQVFSLTWHVVVTLILFFSTVGITLVVESLGVVMSLTGNVAGSALGFILPAAIALSPTMAKTGKLSLAGKLGPVLLGLFGCGTLVLGIVTIFM